MIYILVFSGLLFSIVALVMAKRNKNNDDHFYSEQGSFVEESLQKECGDNEKILVMCPADYKQDDYYAVSQKKLFIRKKDKMTTVPLESIVAIKMKTVSGNKTSSVESCFSAKLKTGDNKSYTLYRYSDKFSELLLRIYEKKR